MRHSWSLTLAAGCAALLMTSAALAQQWTGTLQRINDSGRIVIGHRTQSPPFSFIDGATKQPAGYSIDLCNRIAEAVKQTLGRPDLRIEYAPLTAEDRIDKVADGSVDIECGVTTNTLSRNEKVDFSNTIFITGGSMLVPSTSPLRGLGDLGDKKVAVTANTTTERELTNALARGNVAAKIVRVDNHKDGMTKLEKGEVDAFAADQVVLIGLAREAKEPNKLALVPELFSYEPYGLVVRRNDADFRLVANRVLADLYRSGEIAVVYDKWFGDWGARPSPLLIAMFALNGLPE